MNKFGVPSGDLEFRRRVVEAYTRGLCWVFAYYYQVRSVCAVGKVASGGLKCLSLAQCFPVFVPSLPGMPFVEVVLSLPLCTLCL